MKWKGISVLLALGWAFAPVAAAEAQTLDLEMARLAGVINEALVARGVKNVAAIDFTDLQGQPTELGRLLSERLTIEIVTVSLSGGGVTMLDRANIKSVLAEHRLTEEGLVNPANAKRLGEFAGVDAILIGNVTALDSGIELMVKAIATESSQIVAAGRASFPKTADIQWLLNRGISSNTPSPASAATAGGSVTTYQRADAIATKDIGSLRVVLKSVLPMRFTDRGGRSVDGITCTFEITSRETQRDIVVAMNGAPVNSPAYPASMADVLRTTLVDEHGTMWRLSISGVTGISIVSVGKSDTFTFFMPAEIGALLQRRDAAGTNMFTPVNRMDPLRRGPDLPQQAFVLGSTTSIPPGQSQTVVMSFVRDARATTSGAPPTFFQLNGEIVVGVVMTDRRTSYSLHNLTFDRISMPSGGR